MGQTGLYKYLHRGSGRGNSKCYDSLARRILMGFDFLIVVLSSFAGASIVVLVLHGFLKIFAPKMFVEAIRRRGQKTSAPKERPRTLGWPEIDIALSGSMSSNWADSVEVSRKAAERFQGVLADILAPEG